MRQKSDWMILSFLTLVIIGSSMGLVIGMVDSDLGSLKGSATTCDCTTCTNDSAGLEECWHTQWPADPNGQSPLPPWENGGINPHNDPNQSACSSRFCIKNTVFFAECPEQVNGGPCPTTFDTTKWIVFQEIKDAGTGKTIAGCTDPSYTVVYPFTPTACKKNGSSNPVEGTCSIAEGSCAGATLPEFWDHDNDPNTPDERFYIQKRYMFRTVCNVNP